ncbi:hypothetical protein MRX96_049503 [Rhipicephalus microplus]
MQATFRGSFHIFQFNYYVAYLHKLDAGPGKQPRVPSDRSEVCSLHFKLEDYKQGLKSKRLKPDAIPTIFRSYPAYLQQQLKKERRHLKRPPLSSSAGGLDVDAKRKMLETSNFQYEDQSREVESGHKTGCSLFEPSSAQEQGNPKSMSMEESSDPNIVPYAQEQGNPESMSMEESIDPNIAPGQVQHGPESAQACSTGLRLAQSISDTLTECALQEMPPILLLAPATSCKASLVLKKPTRTRGIQTRLHSTKIVKLEKKLKTLTRKYQRLVKKNESLKNLYDLQEKQGVFKLVRCLTKNHFWPSNFEKVGVGRAVAIFYPQVTSVLRFLQQHGDRLGTHGFEDCLRTVEFVEMVYKWFVLHNIQSTTLHWTSRDAMRIPFYGEDDER